MSRMARKKAISMSEAIDEYIKVMKLSSGLNTQRIFEAWDACSGASAYTLRKFFRDGKLYITLSSSVVRNQMSFQKPQLIGKINAHLSQDELFTKDDPRVGYVNELILK